MEAADADFWIDERAEDDGRVQLGLVGELDIASASALNERLRALAQRGDPVVLDLARLQFIDSSGLRELIRAVSDAPLSLIKVQAGRRFLSWHRRTMSRIDCNVV